jgi:hypothetical protein
MDAFQAAEAQGQNGVPAALAALPEAGDPDGHFEAGLELYHRAIALSQQAEVTTDPAEREHMLAEAATLVNQGTFRLALHEQWLVQPLFADPAVASIMGAVTPTLVLHTPNHQPAYDLIDQGSWANFADRMGLEPVDGSAYDDNVTVFMTTDATGPHYWRLPAEPPAGTIAYLFQETARTPGFGRAMRDGVPTALAQQNITYASIQ